MPARSAAPRRLDQTVTRVLARIVGLAAIAVVVAVGVILWRSTLYNQTHSYIAAQQAVTLANNGMLDQQAGLQDYIDTGQPTYLQPYVDGRQEVAEGDSRLQQLVAGDGALVDGLIHLRLAQNDWTTGWADPAEAGGAPADAPSFVAMGHTLFARYRTAQAALTSMLDARINAAENTALLVSSGGLVTELIIAMAGAGLWWRTRRSLRRAVVGPVSAILHHLQRIEEGDFRIGDDVASGPAELREITRRLSSVANTLDAAQEAARQREHDAAEHATRLRSIVDMGREIAGSLNLHYVLQAVSRSVIGIGVGRRCVIWLTDDTRGVLVPTHDSAGAKGRVVGLDPIAIGDQVSGKAARFGRIVGPEEVSHPAVTDPWSWAIAVPMIVGVRVVGVIEAGADHEVEMPTALMEIVDTLSSQAATAIEAARLYERAEQQSRTDALTLLPNRLDLDSALASEVSRAQRYGRALSVAMLDLDHFKEVNDTFGHARGDDVLQEAAAVMRGVLRDVDTIYRYGGEEFLVVMPETNAATAVELCDRVRATVSDRVALPSGSRLTLSAGVAAFPDHAHEPSRLVTAADDALYRAKRAGRNQVMTAAATPAPGERAAIARRMLRRSA